MSAFPLTHKHQWAEKQWSKVHKEAATGACTPIIHSYRRFSHIYLTYRAVEMFGNVSWRGPRMVKCCPCSLVLTQQLWSLGSIRSASDAILQAIFTELFLLWEHNGLHWSGASSCLSGNHTYTRLLMFHAVQWSLTTFSWIVREAVWSHTATELLYIQPYMFELHQSAASQPHTSNHSHIWVKLVTYNLRHVLVCSILHIGMWMWWCFQTCQS